jgi:hypothetical protein
MLSLRRVIVASAIALPLTMGSAGVALADGYHGHDATAGPDGVSDSHTSAVTGGYHGHHGHFHGGAAFAEVNSTTGPEGPSTEWIFAVASEDGGVVYYAGRETAGAQGVSSTAIGATSGHWG